MYVSSRRGRQLIKQRSMEGASCDTNLALGLGYGEASLPNMQQEAWVQNQSPPEPSLTLALPTSMKMDMRWKVYAEESMAVPQSCSNSTASSFSKLGSEERERFVGGGGDDEEDGSARKKLRLSKEQSVLLEDRFKEHSTLNTRQKQALAKQLNLRPRQVEVWFQNRRARTKAKQTETDCELLRRCCETLVHENRRLQKELQELKTSKPWYMKLHGGATTVVCTKCQRVVSGVGEYGRRSPAVAVARKTRLFKSFNPSAAY